MPPNPASQVGTPPECARSFRLIALDEAANCRAELFGRDALQQRLVRPRGMCAGALAGS